MTKKRQNVQQTSAPFGIQTVLLLENVPLLLYAFNCTIVLYDLNAGGLYATFKVHQNTQIFISQKSRRVRQLPPQL